MLNGYACSFYISNLNILVNLIFIVTTVSQVKFYTGLLCTNSHLLHLETSQTKVAIGPGVSRSSWKSKFTDTHMHTHASPCHKISWLQSVELRIPGISSSARSKSRILLSVVLVQYFFFVLSLVGFYVTSVVFCSYLRWP